MAGDEAQQPIWHKPTYRKCITEKIEETILQSGLQLSRSSIELENVIFKKAKKQVEYMCLAAGLINEIKKRSQNQTKEIMPEDEEIVNEEINKMLFNNCSIK